MRIEKALINRTAPDFVLSAKAAEEKPVRKTALEIARERHDARTPEQIEDIKRRAEERQERLALEQAIGIKRGNPMTFKEANEMRGNPHFAEERQYNTNCQSCVVANEMRRRGWDVEAFGNIKNRLYNTYQLSRHTEAAWLDGNGNIPVSKEYKRKLKQDGSTETILKFANRIEREMEPGGRYHVKWAWNSGKTGHIITAEKRAYGSVHWYDPQSGKYALLREILKRVQIETPIKVLRVDNLHPNTDVLRGVVKKAKSNAVTPLLDSKQVYFWNRDRNSRGFSTLAQETSKSTNIHERLEALRTEKGAAIIQLQRDIIKDKAFKPVENIKGVWSAISTTDPDYARLIAGAKRATEHGYDVYIMPNPKGLRTADYILRKKGFIGSYDLKTIMGDNSVSNRLMESVGQTTRVLLNMATQYNPRTLAKDIQGYFEYNHDAVEIKIFKGKREISIHRSSATAKDFTRTFMRLYTGNK